MVGVYCVDLSSDLIVTKRDHAGTKGAMHELKNHDGSEEITQGKRFQQVCAVAKLSHTLSFWSA